MRAAIRPITAIRYAWQPYVVAIALIAAAAAMRLWPLQILGSRLAWLTFYPAVAVAALYGGLSAGLLAAFLSCLTALFLWPALVAQPFIRDSADWLGMAVFFSTCVLISGVAEALQRARTREKQANEQLGAANRELEAFSYSVSHDLRAPLRGIDGWSQALIEDYGGQLDEQGQAFLNRVRSETQRMGSLIDDLLQLSQVTRAEMHTERMDLSAIAQTITARLRESEPERQVEFTIQKDLSARGDPHLLESALNNLLDNAFKFTSKTPNARIEFGQVEFKGEHAFFVRDNGAGFDMAFANNLFGAFQRMHKASEFPGTGVGLATVKRIVHRHGGRVWAESAVNEGATFHFTIEETP